MYILKINILSPIKISFIFMEMLKICKKIKFLFRYAAAYFMEELMKTINANIFLVEYPRYGIYESN